MTYNTFLALCADSAECSSFDQYAAECGGGCPEYHAIEILQFCWEYGRYHSFASIHRLSGLSQASFSRAYQVPLRCIEDWLHGRHSSPSYVTDLLAFSVCCNLYCD